MIWTKSAIREARKTELAPLLVERGYRLLPVNNGNFRILPALSTAEGPDPDDPSVPACPELCRGAGLVVKQSFWIWSEKNIAGNAIDFFMKVEGKSFHQAMQIITGGGNYDASERNLREEHGNVAKTAR